MSVPSEPAAEGAPPAPRPAPASAPAPRGGRLRRWLRALPKRLALFFASLVLTLLLLELVTRLFLPAPAPVLVRDGLYRTTLPLVNGRPTDRTLAPAEGAPLAEEKAPGELRVFVFGESSVEGAPYGHAASPVTMLHDQLRAALPERPVTVVNMGRVSAYTMDAWYFLVTIGRFAPDVVVFYMGTNDRYDADAEMCWPLDHPALHGVWRRLVARSRLLWSVRALAPSLFLGDGDARGGDPTIGTPRCDRDQAFARWTDVLLATARATGAAVIVAPPIQNVLTPIDYAWAKAPGGATLADILRGVDDPTRALFAAVFAGGRGLDGALRGALDALRGSGPAGRVVAGNIEAQWRFVERLGDAWRAAAAAHGATLAPFPDALRAATPSGVAGAPLVLDEVHLSLEGYWILAREWTKALLPLVGAPAAPLPPERLPPERAAAYVAAIGAHGASCGDLLTDHGLGYLRRRMPLLAAGILVSAGTCGADVGDAPALALGWLRTRLGLPVDLPAALAARVAALPQDPLPPLEEEAATRSAR